MKILLLLPIFLISCSTLSFKAPEPTQWKAPYSLAKYGAYEFEEKDFDFPIEDHPHVQYWLNFFLNTEKGQIAFNRYLFRGEKYIPFLRDILLEEKMPQDLVFLSMIESGFSNYATSSASAVGLWQFIESTGRNYGLTVNSFVDERRDPEKATKAAVKYLRVLHDEFKDWKLAVAAYNCGEARVRRAILEGKTDKYWELVERRLLPLETSQYVPKMMAVMLMSKNAEVFGFRQRSQALLDYKYWDKFGYNLQSGPMNSDLHQTSLSLATEEVDETDTNYRYFSTALKVLPVENSLDLIKLSSFLNISFDELKIYNPQIVGWFLNPEHVKELWVPEGLTVGPQSLTAEVFKPQFQTKKITSTITWKNLSKKLNIKEKALKEFNPSITAGQVKAGQKINLPMPSYETPEYLGLERTARKK